MKTLKEFLDSPIYLDIIDECKCQYKNVQF